MDSLLSSSSLEHKKEYRAFRPKELWSMQKSPLKTVDFRIYRLENTLRRDSFRMAPKIVELVKNLISEFKATDYDETDLISTLPFLKKFSNRCDSIGFYKKAAPWQVFCVMGKAASLLPKARLWLKKKEPTGMRDERLFSYVKVVDNF